MTATNMCSNFVGFRSSPPWIKAIFEENPMQYQKLTSAVEAVREACSNRRNVTQTHHQLVSLVNPLELAKKMKEFD